MMKTFDISNDIKDRYNAHGKNYLKIGMVTKYNAIT